MSHHIVEVHFNDGDASLAGDLWLPVDARDMPVVLIVPGSGPATRDDQSEIREHLAAHGIATFAWDKPGLGGSLGDWRRQRIVTGRAEEAGAAVRAVLQRPEIDPGRVGLWGISQGGWVVPLVAATTPEVSFIIPVSAPGISVTEQILYGYADQMRAGGQPEKSVEEFVVFLRSVLEAAQAGTDYAEVERTLIAPARTRPWYPAVELEIDATAWDELLAGEAHDLDYYLAPVLERVACPVLAVFGADDPLLPVSTSASLFKDTLARAGNPDVTVVVFPDADHLIRIQDPPEYAPGYLALLVEWISERAGDSAAR